MLLFARHSSFPGLGRMFMARPHRRALACLGFWVRRLLQSARRNRHRVNLRGCQTESRRSKGQVNRRAGHVAERIRAADRGLARPGATVSWLPMAQAAYTATVAVALRLPGAQSWMSDCGCRVRRERSARSHRPLGLERRSAASVFTF